VRSGDRIVAAEILAMFNVLPGAFEGFVGGETLNRNDLVSKTGIARVVRLLASFSIPID